MPVPAGQARKLPTKASENSISGWDNVFYRNKHFPQIAFVKVTQVWEQGWDVWERIGRLEEGMYINLFPAYQLTHENTCTDTNTLTGQP